MSVLAKDLRELRTYQRSALVERSLREVAAALISEGFRNDLGGVLMDSKELEQRVNHYTALAEEAKEFVERREAMTMRDEFAMRAMQAVFGGPIASSNEEKDYIAMHAYKMADAMLRARKL
jgi:hypothetical protein